MAETAETIARDAQAIAARELDEDALFAQLAESAGLGADETDPAEEGRSLFSRVLRRHRDEICASPIVKSYISSANISDTTVIATHLASLLVAVKGLNVALLVALMLRIGLRSLCAEPRDAAAGGA